VRRLSEEIEQRTLVFDWFARNKGEEGEEEKE
jgi:hypothetical protein